MENAAGAAVAPHWINRFFAPKNSMATILGSHVRVGMADSLFLGHGQLATPCPDQVAKIRRILSEASLEIAAPYDERELLGLKGAPG